MSVTSGSKVEVRLPSRLGFEKVAMSTAAGMAKLMGFSDDRIPGKGGDVSGEAEAGDFVAACAGELLLRDLVRGLHLSQSPYSSV